MGREYPNVRPRARGPIARLIEWMDGDGAEPVGRICEWSLVMVAIFGAVSVIAVGRDSSGDRDLGTAATATTECAEQPRMAG